MAYYRRRVMSGARDAVTLGLLPLAAAAFLAYVLARSAIAAPASQNLALAGVAASGLALMAFARYGLKSRFFAVPREADPGRTP